MKKNLENTVFKWFGPVKIFNLLDINVHIYFTSPFLRRIVPEIEIGAFCLELLILLLKKFTAQCKSHLDLLRGQVFHSYWSSLEDFWRSFEADGRTCSKDAFFTEKGSVKLFNLAESFGAFELSHRCERHEYICFLCFMPTNIWKQILFGSDFRRSVDQIRSSCSPANLSCVRDAHKFFQFLKQRILKKN